MFPVELVLEGVQKAENTSPMHLNEIFKNLLLNIVDNPINALSSGNYLGNFSLGDRRWYSFEKLLARSKTNFCRYQ